MREEQPRLLAIRLFVSVNLLYAAVTKKGLHCSAKYFSQWQFLSLGRDLAAAAAAPFPT